MNYKLDLLIICLTAVFTGSCRNGGSPTEEQRIDSAQARVLKIELNDRLLGIDSIVAGYEFIPLETSEECLIGGVDRLQFYDNKYYILDRRQQKALLVFGNDGKLLNRIGRNGRGPGEYTEPTDFIVTDSTVTVFDMFGRKFLSYEQDGTFIASKPLDCIIYEIEANSDGSLLYAVSGDNGGRDSLRYYNLFRMDKAGRILSKIYKNKYAINFSDGYDLQCFNDDIIYKKAFESSVYSLRKDILHAKYTFDIATNALPANYEKVCKGDYERFIDRYRDEYTYFNGKFWETDRYVGIGISCKRVPHLIIYDKDTHRSVSGLAGITYNGDKVDVNGLLVHALCGTVDVRGDHIFGMVDAAYIPAEMQLREKTDGFSNPILVRITLTGHPTTSGIRDTVQEGRP